MYRLLILATALPILTAMAGDPPEFWYGQPAREWTEALPVGNGRLGAMVFGDPMNERIQLNEISVWAGPPVRRVSPGYKEAMDEARALWFAGRQGEAPVRFR